MESSRNNLSNDYDYFSSLPRYNGDVAVLSRFFIGFMSGDSPSDTVNKIYNSNLGVSKDQAEDIVWDWLNHRNIEYLANLTKISL